MPSRRSAAVALALAVPALGLGSGYLIATPRRVARLMATLLELEQQHSVYDPCCGAGRLLLAADEVRREALPGAGDAFGGIYGQEIQAVPAALARRSLRRRRSPAFIAGGSSLQKPAFLDEKGGLQLFDRVIANPNWVRPVREQVYTGDQHDRFPWGRPPLQIGDWAWAQHVLAHLAAEGTAVLMLDAEVTSRDGDPTDPTAERDIRRKLVEAGHVRTVLSNPWPLSRRPGLVTRLSRRYVPRAVIMVLDKHPDPEGGVLMIDSALLLGRYQRRELSAEEVTREVLRLHQQRESVPGTSRLVDVQAVCARGADLTPSLYV